ncbi:MAG: 6-carboxytetrahydropterin synthase [Bacteroidetes bacterium]|nr:MAG: 6-carboxytetrahydropterin synthase [Bacteroidota bacterium]
MLKICRRETFNAAHRLFTPGLSDEENRAIYGPCSNLNYHGHNYVLEVWVGGEVNQETGFVMDLKVLAEIIHEEVKDPFDHRNLNLDCPEFANLNPTAENIILVIWKKIRPRIDAAYSLELRLWETDKNSVYYNGAN